MLLDGLALLITEGAAAAAPTLIRAINAFTGTDIPAEQLLQFGFLAIMAAATLWDVEGCNAISTRQLELVRASGALALVPQVVTSQAAIAVRFGDFERADSAFAEVQAVIEATGTRLAPYGPMQLAALRGREEAAFPLIEAASKEAVARAEGLGVQFAHWATAVLCNGLGRYEEALTAAQLATGISVKLFVYNWALSELVEAAVRCQRRDVAADALERLARTTNVIGSDWGMGMEARSRALLSDGEAAEGFYRDAVTRLGQTGFRLDLARAHLVYGEWLRRERRRVKAREQLRVAHEMFTAMGSEAFAERARIELQATGATARRRVSETSADLTSQETQVCRFAADGATNAEIAGRLFVSASTVDYHLRKAFRKLGIQSRTQLAGRLGNSADRLNRIGVAHISS